MLYRAIRGPVPVDARRVPLGQAKVVREGVDATIVTYGVGVHWAVEAAENWEKRGRKLEVIDLRTLIPWDKETVLTSVKKTNRVLVLHEATRTGGFGGEIASQIAELVFEHLDAPPKRLGGADLPIAFSKSIEDDIYSAKGRLDGGIEELLSY